VGFAQLPSAIRGHADEQMAKARALVLHFAFGRDDEALSGAAMRFNFGHF
jgi:hypothetical protein